MARTVISFGEALWDLLPAGPVLGGAPCNLASRLHELGNQALLVSRVGSDTLGTEALAQMEALGLDLTHVQVDATHPTGTVEITLDKMRQPEYDIIQQVAYDFIEANDILLDAARRADSICFGVLAQRGERSRKTLAALLDVAAPSALKFLDINLRKNCFTRETIAESLRRADVLKLNEDEAVFVGELLGMSARHSLTARASAFLQDWSLQYCVVTLAERGALCASADGNTVYEPGFVTNLVDPCGAGDAFSAAFLHGLLSGDDVRTCLRLGNALGALVASQHGATQRIDAAAVARLESAAERNVEDSLSNLSED